MFCQFLFPLINEQKKRGHYVCACGSDDPESEQIRKVGIEYFSHGQKRDLNPVSLTAAVFKIRRILMEQKIEVLICHTALGNLLGRLAGHLAKTRTVIHFAHGLLCAPGQGVINWQLRYLEEKLLGYLSDAVIVMNDYDENLCKNRRIIRDTKKIFRIPGMGVDLRKFSLFDTENARKNLAEQLRIAPSNKIVLCVAWLIPEKGVLYYLDAARQVCGQRKDVCFLLAGTGPLLEKLKQRCVQYGLKDNFKILGWREDVHFLMRASDIFVLPTYYCEGLPLSIIEAMASGKPTVVTQHRGCEDAVLDGRTGFLVPRRQVGPLAEKIMELADSEELCEQMGRAGRQRVEQLYEINSCTEKIATVLEIAMR